MIGTAWAGAGFESEASSLIGLPDWAVGEVESGACMPGWGEGVTCGMFSGWGIAVPTAA